jgi:hypothetical protein
MPSAHSGSTVVLNFNCATTLYVPGIAHDAAQLSFIAVVAAERSRDAADKRASN